MKRLLLLALLFILIARECVYAQNMVLNGSFEDTLSCPISSNQFSMVKNWFEPHTCSADYFNTCSNGNVGIPENYVGYQSAHDGSGYIGIVTYVKAPGISNLREFAEGELITPLQQGKKYCVEFYVSLTVNEQWACNYAVNAIGCLFTTDSFQLLACDQEIPFTPQVENTQGVITDTTNWILITGNFIANGGEKFLTIGNFRNDSNTSVIKIDSTFQNSYNAYYYIDNVSVTLCDTTAIEELQIADYRLQIYPNPASGSVTVTTKGGEEIIISDVAGRRIKEYKISEDQMKINTERLSMGVYFISLYSKNNLLAIKKFFVAIE